LSAIAFLANARIMDEWSADEDQAWSADEEAAATE
jgi:hypothetical protein